MEMEMMNRVKEMVMVEKKAFWLDIASNVVLYL